MSKQAATAENLLFVEKTEGTTGEKIEKTYSEELIFALCGPIGSPIHDAGKTLKTLLEGQFAYECKIIRLSSLIKDYCQAKIDTSSPFKKTKSLIENGNKMRHKHGHSILVELAIHQISGERKRKQEDQKDQNGKPSERFKSRRVCYIIDSIKNREELKVLQKVYRGLFYSIGVFALLEKRVNNLIESGIDKSEVDKLIDRDSGEEFDHGQSVRAVFPESDFFIQADENNLISESELRRFLDLIFGTEIITPSSDETAMHAAMGAAARSACLSRQVGAAITDADGKVISLGWNDVPKFGGDLYQSEDEGVDRRCFRFGKKCHNDHHKNDMTEKILDKLISKAIIQKDKIKQAREAIRSSKIDDIIEYSRAVHAEMHAILSSVNNRQSLHNGKLYCTTYPCHSCARHIVAAGIKEVQYIQPYTKSLTTELHEDSISESEPNGRVLLKSFIGVSPKSYRKLYTMDSDSRKIKKEGVMKEPVRRQASPRFPVTLESIPSLEAKIVTQLELKKIIQENSDEQKEK